MNWENEGDAEIPDVSLLSSVKLFLIRKWKSQKILILVSFLIEDHKLSDQTIGTFNWLSLCCCCSVTKLCLILCNLVDDSTPDSSVLHLSPRVSSDLCPLSWWCHPTISSFVAPFSLCLQSFPASGSFPMSQLFPSGGQSTGTSASTSVLPVNIQGWFPLGLTGLISWQSKGLSRVFSSTTIWKHHFIGAQPSLWSNSHICMWLLEKP